MIWRKLRFDWSHTLGEFLIVIAGVLIALAIDQWNDDRLERQQEVDAIARILAELKGDLRSFDLVLKAIGEKEDSLLRVRDVLISDAQMDPSAFLSDIVVGANFGWNQGMARRSTYDSLVGSGKLGIIVDPVIRIKITTYYRYYKDSYNRIDERETGYPALSYQLVPRSDCLTPDDCSVSEEIEPGLSDVQLNEFVALVRASSIGDHVVAELNLARFIRRIVLINQARAKSLVGDLEAYQLRLQ